MKLIGSDRSPYVRKVLVTAFELDLIDRIERMNVVVSVRNLDRDADNPNPFQQIPTLIADDGTAIHDSLVICEYLSSLVKTDRLFTAPAGRIELLTRHASAHSMLDILLRRLGERNRAEAGQENEYAAAYRTKLGWGLDHLETYSDGWMGNALEIAQITTACVLSYIDFRFAADMWREGRPKLAEWFSRIEARPSMQQTIFKG